MINPFEPKATIRCLVALPRRCRSNAPSQSAALLARILLVSLAMVWPLAAFAQSSSSQPTSSSSQQSSTEPKTQSQAQPATLDPPPKEEDSLAEAARKAKAKKPAAYPWWARRQRKARGARRQRILMGITNRIRSSTGARGLGRSWTPSRKPMSALLRRRTKSKNSEAADLT